MLRLSVRIGGKDRGDLTEALREVCRLVDAGYCSGSNSNDDGDFYFDMKGEEENHDPNERD